MKYHKEVRAYTRRIALAVLLTRDDDLRGALLKVSEELSFRGLKNDDLELLFETIDDVAEEFETQLELELENDEDR